MRFSRWLLAAFGALLLQIAVPAVAQTSSSARSFLQLSRAGVTALDGPQFVGPIDDAAVAIRAEHDTELVDAKRDEMTAPAPAAALAVPNPPSGPAPSMARGRVSGFAGISHLDQRLAGAGIYANSQFSLEPPDQALCVGNGFVMEAVNLALAVHRAATGAVVAGPTPLNQFFLLAPAVIRGTPPVFGDFTSDPKCYYDAQVRRWFVTILQIDVNPATGGFARPGRSHLLLAVSQSADPTGGFNVFRIDSTNDGGAGTPSHSRCPCFGDQPLLGADDSGIFLTTNEFPIFRSGFNGAQIYALSKAQLAAGIMPTVVHFDGGPLEEGPSYSVQPATSPRPGRRDDSGGGVEFFLSPLDFEGTLDNRIAVWSMTHTRSLATAVPDVELTHVVIRSEVYGQPPDAEQKAGPTPLRDAARIPDPESLIAANDDRMNQVVFADGLLFAGVNTIVSGGRVGIAWFAVDPATKDGRLSAKIHKQGYITAAGNSVIFPSIAVNADGDALVAFTLTGRDFFPSAAFARLDDDHASRIRIAAAGAAPEDGFSGYPSLGGDVAARWGDYSAAVADEHGNLWFATEFIPNAPRTTLANWGTFIGKVSVEDDDR